MKKAKKKFSIPYNFWNVVQGVYITWVIEIVNVENG